MRPLKDVWAEYAEYTALASNTVRTSAIAGLLAVWLFSGGQDAGVTALAESSNWLVVAGAFFAGALGADVLHYTVGSLAYEAWARNQETRHDKSVDDEVDVPLWLPGIPTTFFYGKILALIVGYFCLTWFLADAIST